MAEDTTSPLCLRPCVAVKAMPNHTSHLSDALIPTWFSPLAMAASTDVSLRCVHLGWLTAQGTAYQSSE